MEAIDFFRIHNVVLDTLSISGDYRLEVTGKWYFDFLNSEEVDLKLSIPSFDFEFSKTAYNYLRLFSLTFSLVNKKQLSSFDNSCLFNIFKYNPKRKVNNINDFVLKFKNIKNNIALWGLDTITELNQFLPVFNSEQIISEVELVNIYNSFSLFMAIRSHKLINYPVLVDLNKEILSFNVFNDLITKNNVSEKIVLVSEKLDDQTAEDLEDELIQNKINIRINIGYPYSKKPHPYLLDNNICDKRFGMTFMNRFIHLNEDEAGIRLLPRECSENKSTSILCDFEYEIINTEHNKILFDLLKDFKNKWRNLGLNKFVAPFPKEWFLFVNNGLPKEEWLVQFKNDYPIIANKPIINEIEKIISELHDLDWAKNALQKYDNSKILIPEFIGLKEKRLRNVFKSFKEYIEKLYPKINFIEETNNNDFNNIILLDIFNIVDIVNRGQLSLNGKLKIVVPDFIYYSSQPYIKYYLFDYQASILINKSREKLDVNFKTNKENILSLKKLLFKEINNENKIYNKKYDVKIEEPTLEDIESYEENEAELTGAEEAEFAQKESTYKNPLTLIITTINNEEIDVLENEMILVQRNCFSKLPAKALLVGDLFLLNSDLNDLINDDNLYNRLSEIPKDIISYQNDLFQYKDIYNILKSKGISYTIPSYFNGRYVLPVDKLNDESFKIPGSKKDWLIICDFLSIPHNVMHLVFVAYYGRKKKNRIKELYRLVIDLFLENDYFGMTEDLFVLKEIQNILADFDDIFKVDGKHSPEEIAISIAATIMNELKFREVKEIKILNHE